MIVISDTSCLDALAVIQQLEILPALFGSIVIPPAVEEELRSSPRAEEILRQTWLSVIRPTSIPPSILGRVHQGEAEAIALAVEHKAALLLIDERTGDRLARELAIRTIGTLACLVMAKEQGLVEKVSPLLDALIAGGFFVGDNLRDEVIRAAGE